jgi:ribosomal protein S18 acetylase RimI-like enzyme
MEIREARPEEYEETGRVIVQAYDEFIDPRDEGWDEYLALMADVAGRVDRTVVLVAVEGGRVLGTATIELDDVLGDDDRELPPDTAALRMFGVLPEARGRGIARALMDDVLGRIRGAGKTSVILRTTAPMIAAQRLYTSIGFERAPDLDQQVTEEFGLIGYRLRLG